MNYVGIDPSFKRTGIAIYTDKKIFVTRCESEPNSDKSFPTIWSDAVRKAYEIDDTIKRIVNLHDDTVIISECPPPRGMFSPGLYALDSILFDKLRLWTDKIFVVYPNYLGHVHGKRKYNKSESLHLAQNMMSKLPSELAITLLNKRMCHDESEAYIFLMHLCIVNGMFREELKEFKSLFTVNEKVLFER